MNEIINDLGFHPVTSSLFILKEMQKYNLSILLFSLIFQIVILIFITISVLLIYSLLLVGVETKTMESGIMRMVGASKRGLVQMIFVQSLMFVVPAITLAFILCFPVLALCFKFIFQASLNGAFKPVPTWDAVILALSVGIFIPLISSILPIMKILG